MIDVRDRVPEVRHKPRRSNGSLAVIALVVSYLVLSAGQGRAQMLAGSIDGTVVDASRAGVPQTTVTAVQSETHRTRVVVTDQAGDYNMPELSPGRYNISISHAGFSLFTAVNIEVRYNEAVRIDAALEVSANPQTIDVNDALPLQTDRSDVRADLTSEEIADLPQPTRTYEGLLGIVAGVAPPQATPGGTNNPARSMYLEANGTSASATDVRIEGISAVNPWVQFYSTAVPSIEAIQTVNIVTAGSEAGVTLAAGATVNVQLKTGTNQFHGELYEYHEDNVLKAKPFFLPPGQSKPKNIDNDPGGTIGGPIVRNRLFFFGSYEGDFTRSVSGQFATVPTAAMLGGDFSQTGTTIYNPATGSPDGTGKTPFSGAVIPPSLIDPHIQKLLSLIPAPNTNEFGPNSNNYYGNLPTSYNLHKIDTKIDWSATNRLRIGGRADIDPYLETQVPIFGSILGTSGGAGYPTPSQHGIISAVTASATYVATPNFVVVGTWGFTIPVQYLIPIDDNQKYGAGVLGIPGVNLGSLPAAGGLPQFNLNGYTGYGYAYPYLRYDDSVSQYSTDATLVKGRHTIRFGANIVQQHMNHNEVIPDAFNFSGGVTSLNGGALPNQFNAFADFLLGLPNSWNNDFQPFGISKLRSWEYALYVQDTWQATRRLTISYGTAWEYFPVPTHGDHGLELYNPATNVYEVCGYGGTPKDCGIKVAKDIFAPRFGFAYRPAGSLVIRGGFSWSPLQLNMARDGIYNYPETVGYSATALNPYVAVGSVSAGIPTLSLPDLSHGVIPLVPGAFFEADPLNYHRGSVQSYSFFVQKGFGSWSSQIGYLGTHTLSQLAGYDINYGQIGGGVASEPLYQLDGISSPEYLDLPYERMHFDSLQATLQGKLAAGVRVRANYTFSKWLGTCCETDGDAAPEISIPQYWKLNYALEPGDVTHNFALAAIAELPFGKGKRFLTSGPSARILGGWQVNAVLTALSGTPFSVTADGSSLNAPGSTQRADLVKPSVAIYGQVNEYFDPTAFAPVTQARFGTAGFDLLRGPGATNLDLSLFRAFKISERWRVQLRAEAFNLSNTPHFSNPASNIAVVQYGANGQITNLNGFDQITSTNPGSRLVDERYFRLGLKILF